MNRGEAPTGERRISRRQILISGIAAGLLTAACGVAVLRDDGGASQEPERATTTSTTAPEVTRMTPNEELRVLIRDTASRVATDIEATAESRGVSGKAPEEPHPEGYDRMVYEFLTNGGRTIRATIDRQPAGELAGLSIHNISLDDVPKLEFHSLEEGALGLNINDEGHDFQRSYGSDEIPAGAQLAELPDMFDSYWRGLLVEMRTSDPVS